MGLAMSLLGFMWAVHLEADVWNKKTKLSFSQPVELPGHVLPAGTYTFKLADTLADRHIVQVLTADESRVIATVMTIPDYRLTTADQTVIRFREVPRGSPAAIRGWFYPGHNVGQEFVYPKARAVWLAKATKTIVPAIAVDVTDPDALKTAPIIAITPDEKEMPVTAVIQTTPDPTAKAADLELPKTASALPLIIILGLGSLGLALAVMVFGKYTLP